jgi:RNA polymerase sigma-70 factor (ECF subfamily)
MSEKLDRTFEKAVEPLRGGLRLHCYRMLGSSHDSDDVVQETLLRAWRAKDSLKDRERLRPWLYRIATNACLDELKRRPKRGLAWDVRPAATDPRAVAPAVEDALWLEPMPDVWLESAGAPDPSAKYTLKESVALAFVAALQTLSPAQRATLLLRDVVGLSAEEAAEALELSVGAANSALFRARTAVEEKVGTKAPAEFAKERGDVDEATLAEYMRALESSDVEALIAMLHEEVKTAMPPSPTWIAGKEANAAFYRWMFGDRLKGWIRLLRTSANGQPAFAFYRAANKGEPNLLRAIQLVETKDRRIAAVDHFMLPKVFPLFGFPESFGTY